MKKDNKRFWKRPDLLFLCLGFGVVFLLCAILMEYAGTPPIATALLGFLLCVGLGCALLAVAAQRQSAETEQIPDGLIDGEMTSAAFKMDVPALMCDEQGLIVWCNRAMAEACGQNVRAGEQLEHITTLSPAD